MVGIIPKSVGGIKIVIELDVVKIGASNVPKNRSLLVRTDALFFLSKKSNQSGAVLKRHIPIGMVDTMSAYENGGQIHFTILGEHDVLIKGVGSRSLSVLYSSLQKLFKENGLSVSCCFEDTVSVSPDECRLEKSPRYTSVSDRLAVRRAKVPMEKETVTLSQWNSVMSNIPSSIDLEGRQKELREALDGKHVVSLGTVNVHKGKEVTPTILGVTLTHLHLCQEETGSLMASINLFALQSISVVPPQKLIKMTFLREVISSLHFSLDSENPQENHGKKVETDAAFVARTIAKLLTREGISIPVTTEAVKVAASSGGATQSGQGAEEASSSSKKRSVSLLDPTMPIDLFRIHVPDFENLMGPILQPFRCPHTLLGRHILRLTSKGAWEERVITLTRGLRIMIADAKGVMRRSIPLEGVKEVHILQHWESNAMAIAVHDEHDCVFRPHPSTPPGLSLTQVVAVFQRFRNDIPVKKILLSYPKDKLKSVLLPRYNIRKDSSYITPQKEAKMIRSGSWSPTRSVNGSFRTLSTLQGGDSFDGSSALMRNDSELLSRETSATTPLSPSEELSSPRKEMDVLPPPAITINDEETPDNTTTVAATTTATSSVKEENDLVKVSEEPVDSQPPRIVDIEERPIIVEDETKDLVPKLKLSSGDDFSNFTTPQRQALSSSDLTTPLHLTSFPSPSPSMYKPTNPDGSKNFFIRFKCNRDAFSMGVSEEFAAAFVSMCNESSNVATSVRVVSILSGERRSVHSAQLNDLAKLIDRGSRNGWVRKDAILCRTSDYCNWTEIPAIPFSAGLMSGRSPSSLADSKFESA